MADHCTVQSLPIFNALVAAGLLYSWWGNLASRNKKCRSIIRCKTYFDILNHLKALTHECDGQTRRTDSLIAYAALDYCCNLHVLHVSACLAVQGTAHTTSYSPPHQLLPVAGVQLRHERRLVRSRPLRSARQPGRHHDRLAPKSCTPNSQFFAVNTSLFRHRDNENKPNNKTRMTKTTTQKIIVIAIVAS